MSPELEALAPTLTITLIASVIALLLSAWAAYADAKLGRRLDAAEERRKRRLIDEEGDEGGA